MTAPAAQVARWRRRWTPERLADLRAQVAAQARDVRGPHRLETDWSAADGFLDLRGLGAGREPVRLSFLTLSRVDLSHARGAVSLYRCVIEDGRFDHAALATGTRLGRRLERCSFRAARLRGVTLGTEVVGCDFTGADARRLICEPNTRFEDCTFEGVDLSDAALADATFVRCSFAGAVLGPGTSFSRCTFVDTDLDPGPARLTRCRRDGADLPDRWDGAADAEADLQRFAARYAARLAAGETDLRLGDD